MFTSDRAVHSQRNQGELLQCTYICGFKHCCDQIWSELRHPNILRELIRPIRNFLNASNRCPAEFLGANILDEKPFIVMPYLENGNARHYLQKHPDHDRLQIVRLSNFHVRVLPTFTIHMQLHGISLGLVHLHSRGIVHGDLKAVRVPHLPSYMCTAYGHA